MANAREIQARMKSIKDTMKITNAMYMISSSKLQKARRDLKNTEPYFYTIQDCLSKILELSLLLWYVLSFVKVNVTCVGRKLKDF